MGALARAGSAAFENAHRAGTAFIFQTLLIAARFGQVVMPCLFVFGATLVVARRLKAAGAGAGLTPTGVPPGAPRPFTSPLTAGGALSRREFAALAAEVYRRQGYEIEATLDREDGGVDIVLRRKGARYLVRCKAVSARGAGSAAGDTEASEADVLDRAAAHDHESAGTLDSADGIVEDVSALDAQRAPVESRAQLGQGNGSIEKL